MRIKACTLIGCTDSTAVALRTAQLPPAFVAPPTLSVIGESPCNVYCRALIAFLVCRAKSFANHSIVVKFTKSGCFSLNFYSNAVFKFSFDFSSKRFLVDMTLN